MGTTAKNTGTEFPKAPAGTHVARCCWVIDLGTQTTEWMGKKKKQPKILIAWELSNELMDDGRPFTVSNRYTLSLFEQAVLRQHLESWRGKSFTEDDVNGGFDVKNILGAYCMLNIIHKQSNGKTYANVGGVMTLPKGMPKPPKINPDIYFSTDDFAGFEDLPEWIRGIVERSEEYKDRHGIQEAPPSDDNGFPEEAGDLDDVPF